MRNALIIPVLNPGEALLLFVQELRVRAPSLRILIVDDGSGPAADSIYSRLQYGGCDICRHPESYGRGAALKTAIRHMQRHYPGCSGYIVVAAVRQYLVEDILRVAQGMDRNPGRLVLGMGPGIPPGRRPHSGKQEGGTALLRAGLWGIPPPFIPLAQAVPGEGFEYEINFLLRAATYRVPMAEIPIQAAFQERRRLPQFRPVGDTARIGGAILGYRLAALFRGRGKRAVPVLRSCSLSTQESPGERLIQ